MQAAHELERKRERKIAADPAAPAFSFWQRLALIAAAVAIAFLAGLVPSWLSGRETVRQLGAAQANLRISQMQNRLALAAINARKGDYEPARVAASDFFTDLRAEVDSRQSSLTTKQRDDVLPILDQRDALITELARYDAAAADHLTNLYLNYVKAVDPAARKMD